MSGLLGIELSPLILVSSNRRSYWNHLRSRRKSLYCPKTWHGRGKPNLTILGQIISSSQARELNQCQRNRLQYSMSLKTEAANMIRMKNIKSGFHRLLTQWCVSMAMKWLGKSCNMKSRSVAPVTYAKPGRKPCSASAIIMPAGC